MLVEERDDQPLKPMKYRAGVGGDGVAAHGGEQPWTEQRLTTPDDETMWSACEGVKEHGAGGEEPRQVADGTGVRLDQRIYERQDTEIGPGGRRGRRWGR
ncbi:hypothetical protein [Streptomyces sp. IMTB 2501]|uniref:hypothetical protein n=1 Tax=Streptomyces sp. IMTB 2501 TaxID=1776340 RepID=UPI00117E5C44|nr:hypothetical protein [Streptomyces sp. IMTB 2501]